MAEEFMYPFITPEGEEVEVPASKIDKALAKGLKRQFAMTTPQGEPVWVNHDKLENAKQKGLTLDEQQAIEKQTEDIKETPLAKYKGTTEEDAARAALLGATQGVSFGFADEIAGLIGAGKALVTGESPVAGYKETRDLARTQVEEAETTNPVTTMVSNILAGIGSGVGAATAAKAITKTGISVGRAIGVGAAEGAAQAAGETKDITDLKQVAADVGMGTTIGATFAGTLASVPKVGKFLYKGMKARNETAKEIAKDIGAGVQKAMDDTEITNKIEKDALLRIIRGEDLTDAHKNAMEINARKLYPDTKLDTEELLKIRKDTLVNDTLRNITGSTEGKKAEKLSELQRLLKDEGEDFIENSYGRARQSEVMATVLKDMRKGDTAGFGFGGMKYLDNKYVAKFIDAKLGTNVDDLIDRMSQANTAKEHISTYYGRQLKELSKETKAAGVKPEDLFTYIQSKGATPLPEEAKPLVGKYQELFKTLRSDAIEMGLPIRELGDGKWYVPNNVKGTVELLSALRGKATEIEGQIKINPLAHITDDEFKLLSSTDNGKDFIKALEIGSGKHIASAGQFNEFAPRVLNPSSDFVTEMSMAGATRAREGDIPDFIMDKNIESAAQSWINSTFHRALMRDNEGELRLLRDQFRKAGEERMYKWADTLLKDITGSQREGTLKTATEKAKMALRTFASEQKDQATSKVGKEVWQTVQDIPDIWNDLTANLYTNVLGTKPRALVSNLLQPIVMAAPELGTVYGTKVLSKAFQNIREVDKGVKAVIQNPIMAKKLGVKVGDVAEVKGMTNWLQSQNLLGTMDKSLNRPEFKAGLEQGLVAAGLGKSTELASRTGFLYGVTEIYNRKLIGAMGRVLASELVEGGEDAMKYLARMDAGPRKATTKALNEIKALKAAGQEELAAMRESELTTNISRFMLSKSAFNYDKYTASQFARNAGPLLSMFTKWPTSILGDLAYTVKDPRFSAMQKFSQVMGKYMAPAVVMYGVHESMFGGEEPGPAAAKLVGKEGLGTAMPIQSAMGPLGGDVRAVPPIVESVFKGVKAYAKAEDTEGEIKAIWNAAKPFVPGTGAYRLFFEDLPAILTNEEPD